mgnify:FL=1
MIFYGGMFVVAGCTYFIVALGAAITTGEWLRLDLVLGPVLLFLGLWSLRGMREES